MLNPPKILLYSCLVLFANVAPLTAVELPKCNAGEALVAFAFCKPKIDQLKAYSEEQKGMESSPEVVKNKTMLCEKTTRCLAPLHCEEAQKIRKAFEKSCDLLNHLNTDTYPCLVEFFKKAYWAQFSNETSCFHENAFLEKDLKKRHDAYINGESCFLDYAKSNCKDSSFQYFSKNYKKFADTISIKPEGDDCKDPHHQLNALHCKALAEEVRDKTSELKQIKIGPNDTHVAEIINLCKDTQTCINESCVFTDDVRKQVANGCNLLKLMETNFGICLSKFNAEKPDLSKYECFKGIDFYDPSDEVACEKFDKKKECAKGIMSDVCGKESVEDFDRIADVLKIQFECK